MRNYLLAAVAAVAMTATPALARDGAPYVGIEGGVLFVEDLDMDVGFDDGVDSLDIDDAFIVDFKAGIDVDAIAGYDFGLFRLEGELGWKRLRATDIRVSDRLANEIGADDGEFDITERGGVTSLMANGLIDIGDENGWSAYAGLGGGRARVRLAGDTDNAWAYQGIVGIRYAVSSNVDVGLKYRYFGTGKVEFNDEFEDGIDSFDISSRGKLRTHSLLASLTYNFVRPAPVVVAPVIAPPAPVEAPATQTCPDGSVILATDICPAPPAPVPTPERG